MERFLYRWNGWNEEIFLRINSLRIPWIDESSRWATRLGDGENCAWIIFLLLLLLLLRRWSNDEGWGRVLPSSSSLIRCLSICVIGALITLILVKGLKPMFQMPRPTEALSHHPVHLIGGPFFGFSFPSGHATFSMLLAWVFWRDFRTFGRIMLVAWVLWIGFSRVHAGAHFPVDIVGGWIAGSLAGLLAWGIVKSREKRRIK